jgi:hypothetical protein
MVGPEASVVKNVRVVGVLARSLSCLQKSAYGLRELQDALVADRNFPLLIVCMRSNYAIS